MVGRQTGDTWKSVRVCVGLGGVGKIDTYAQAGCAKSAGSGSNPQV